MITNWKILGAGVLGVVAAGIWVPRFFGGSGPKVDPSAEPPAEYWESGATEPWSGGAQPESGASSSEALGSATDEPVGDSDSFRASGSVGSVEVPLAEGPTAGAADPSSPSVPQTSQVSSGDVDTDRLLSVARALRGENSESFYRSPETEPVRDPELGGELPRPAPDRTREHLQDLIDSLHLSATLIGEQSSMAMIDGQLLSVGDPVGTSGVEIVEVVPRRVICRFGEEFFELDIPAFRTREASSSDSFDAIPGGLGDDPEL